MINYTVRICPKLTIWAQLEGAMLLSVTFADAAAKARSPNYYLHGQAIDEILFGRRFMLRIDSTRFKIY